MPCRRAGVLRHFSHALCRHHNVVQFFGASLEPEEMFMVTELMAGDLFSALRDSQGQDSSEWLWYRR